MAKNLYDVANELIDELDDGDHPAPGETWVYRGRDVRVTGGSYRGELNGRPYGICNCWTVTFLDSGESGGAYDNDRRTFYRKPKPEPE